MGNRILLTRVFSAAIITLLLSGCGAPASTEPAVSNSISSSQPTEIPFTGLSLAPTATPAPLSTVDFELSNGGLAPNSFVVPVGLQVIFKVKNSLKAIYGCHLRDLKTVKQYPTLVFWKLDNIAAGTTTSGMFTAPSKPASFEIGCGVSPYPSNGITQDNMIATLNVK